MQKTISIKMLAVFLVLVLVIGCVVGGTVAWLIAETDDVVNTFTFGNIKIILDETKVDIDGNPLDEDGDNKADRITGADEQNSYKLIPGASYLKDPKVTVEAKSEKCWLFVTVKEEIAFDEGKTGPFNEFIKYEVYVEGGWKELKSEADGAKVYYRVVDYSKDNHQVFDVLKSDGEKQITVDESLTVERIADLADGSNPTLTFRAYAVQYSGFELKDGDTEINAALNAWNQVGYGSGS